MKKIFTIISLSLLLMMGMADGQTHLWGITQKSIFRTNVDGSNMQFYHFIDSLGWGSIGNLAFGHNGKLYGIASAGGCNNGGTVFSFDPASGLFTDIYGFECNFNLYDMGWNPLSGPMVASDGKIYGMTYYGGNFNQGVIYVVDPATNIYTDIHDFGDSTGVDPDGTLIQLSDGKLYGTAIGGTNGGGVIFSYNPVDSIYTPLHYFEDSTIGQGPYLAGLIKATNGKLYGTTEYGGAHNYGVIFSFDVSTSVYSDIYDFDSLNGYYPGAGVIQATNGLLYGTTIYGGAFNDGNIYSFDISTNTYSDIYDFNQTTNYYDQRKLLQASNGLLFGAMGCANVITNVYGIYFSFDISTNTYTDLYNFDNGANGGYTDCTIIEIPDSLTTGMKLIPNKEAISIYPNPTSSNFTLTYHLNNNPKASFQILDVTGRKVYATNIIGTDGTQNISISDLSNGIYYWEMISNNGIEGKGKIAVIR